MIKFIVLKKAKIKIIIMKEWIEGRKKKTYSPAVGVID